MPLQVVAADGSTEVVGSVYEAAEEKSIYELPLVCSQSPQISELEAVLNCLCHRRNHSIKNVVYFSCNRDNYFKRSTLLIQLQ
jgi:hypothetical protein